MKFPDEAQRFIREHNRKSRLDWIAKQLDIKESTLAAYLNSMGISTRGCIKDTSHLVSRKRLPGGVKCAYNKRVPGSINIMELTNHTCRFPLGIPDQPGFGYCGKHTNTLYCDAHMEVSFNIPVWRQ